MHVSALLQNHGCTPLALGSHVEGEATVVLACQGAQQGDAVGRAVTLLRTAIDPSFDQDRHALGHWRGHWVLPRLLRLRPLLRGHWRSSGPVACLALGHLLGRAIATPLDAIAHCLAQALCAVSVAGPVCFALHRMRLAQAARHP